MNSEYQEDQLVLNAYREAASGKNEAMDTILGLESKCFEGVAPSALWEAMRTLLLKGKPVSEVGIRLELARANELGPNGQYWESFRQFLMRVAEPQPLHTLREGVKDAWLRRELVRISSEKLAELSDPTNAGCEVADSILSEVSELTVEGTAQQSWSDLESRFLETGSTKDEATTQGAWWGINPLDSAYPIPASAMSILAARINTGKSLGGFTIIDATINHGRKAVWVNMDMAADIARTKLVSCISRVEYDKIMNGWCNAEEVARVKLGFEKLGDMVDFLHFPAFTSWEKVRAQASQAIRRSGATCLVLDQFSQIGVERKYGDSDHKRKAHISTSIKNLAQTYNVAAVILAQINRQGSEGEPGLEDLAETGSLEQDACGVWTLWPDSEGDSIVSQPGGKDLNFGKKPSQQNAKFRNNNNIWLRLAKSQIGPVGLKLRLDRRGDISRFEYHERQTDIRF